MLDGFIKYNENFDGKSCILMLFLKEESGLNSLFADNYNKISEIISMTKKYKYLLWIGRTNNSQFRISDFYSSKKRENSLQESIAQLVAGEDITDKKKEYLKTREKIAKWLLYNTEFYARLCSDFGVMEPEIIKKNLIKKYNLPFNRKYNRANFNRVLFAE